MHKLVVTDNSTVDGVIDMAADWFDPLAKDVRSVAPPACDLAPAFAVRRRLTGVISVSKTPVGHREMGDAERVCSRDVRGATEALRVRWQLRSRPRRTRAESALRGATARRPATQPGRLPAALGCRSCAN